MNTFKRSIRTTPLLRVRAVAGAPFGPSGLAHR
jgi:hypothetical protein